MPLPCRAAHAALAQVWETLATGPGWQALEAAVYCRDHAPHLRDYVRAQISATLSDQEYKRLVFHHPHDGRIQALSVLAEIDTPQRPPARAEPVPPTSTPLTHRIDRDIPYTTLHTAVQELVEQITVIEAPKPLPEVEPIRTEPELGRICVGAYCAAEFRLWTIGRHLTREADGSGMVSKKALKAALVRFGVTYTRQHLNRLLQAGNRLFWNLSKRAIFLRTPAYITTQLITRYPELATTNRPGVRDVYLSPAGSLERWEGMLYAGWLTHREGPTISRATLEQLFNRDEETLRRWEQTRLKNILTIRTNYAQADPTRLSFTPPDDSQPYVANVYTENGWEQVIRVFWRLPNTYDPHGIRQHPKRGQARKVRKAANACFDQPADQRRGGTHRLKRYFDSGEALRSYTAEHDTIGYLWRGENRHGHGMLEPSNNGFGVTTANERADLKAERRILALA